MLLSGLLFSGMILGATTTVSNVNAATDNTVVQASSDKEYSITVHYYLRGQGTGNLGKAYATKDITGAAGTPITDVPTGYTFINGQRPEIKADNPNVIVQIDKKATSTVNFIAPNGTTLKTVTINGAENDYDSLYSYLPSGYYWDNDNDSGITLHDGKEYNIPVSQTVANTVLFKTSDGSQVGSTTIRGNEVGDRVTLNGGQVPYGYTTDTDYLVIQKAGNTQTVTVYKSSNVTSFTGVVKVNSNIYASYLYNVKGEEISNRALSGGSSWKVSNKMTYDGKEYYQVSTNEWIPADNVTVTSGSSNNNNNGSSSIDANGSIVSSDVSTITINGNNATGTALYKADGSLISNRGLGSGSNWKTDKMATINGVKMYRVATDEWVPATSVK